MSLFDLLPRSFCLISFCMPMLISGHCYQVFQGSKTRPVSLSSKAFFASHVSTVLTGNSCTAEKSSINGHAPIELDVPCPLTATKQR